MLKDCDKNYFSEVNNFKIFVVFPYFNIKYVRTGI